MTSVVAPYPDGERVGYPWCWKVDMGDARMFGAARTREEAELMAFKIRAAYHS